jgi:tyrosyl-tRNA synthetase
MSSFKPVSEQLAIIKRGTVDIIPENELLAKLERSFAENRPLRIKQGFDPTAPDIHLGHTIGLSKLGQFQELGHTIVLIVGDYTGMVGDPSEKATTRRRLSYEEVMANAQTYLDQFFTVLDKDRTEVHKNSEWFAEMSFNDVMDLASKYTVAKVLARNDFKERVEAGRAISIHEIFYILMQGYDSVAIKADVEIGATEQMFNLLAGRDLQTGYGHEQQIALTFPVLTGTCGTQRMSKSTGNYIGVSEDPETMFGKVMSIPDAIMGEWFDLLSGLAQEEIGVLLDGEKTSPRDAKDRLGRIIVERYHDANAAEAAAENFRNLFSKKALPENMPDIPVKGTCIWIVQLLRDAGFAASGSDARGAQRFERWQCRLSAG